MYDRPVGRNAEILHTGSGQATKEVPPRYTFAVAHARFEESLAHATKLGDLTRELADQLTEPEPRSDPSVPTKSPPSAMGTLHDQLERLRCTLMELERQLSRVAGILQ